MQQFGWIILCQCTWFFMFKYCCYIPSRMFRLAKLTSNHNYLHRLVSKQSRSSKYLFCISYSVCSNSHTTPVRIYGEPYVHKFCAVNIFLEYHPSSSTITRYQVPSRVRAWFRDSAGDIDFYQMSLSQSESTILHESIIFEITTC